MKLLRESLNKSRQQQGRPECQNTSERPGCSVGLCGPTLAECFSTTKVRPTMLWRGEETSLLNSYRFMSEIITYGYMFFSDTFNCIILISKVFQRIEIQFPWRILQQKIG